MLEQLAHLHVVVPGAFLVTLLYYHLEPLVLGVGEDDFRHAGRREKVPESIGGQEDTFVIAAYSILFDLGVLGDVGDFEPFDHLVVWLLVLQGEIANAGCEVDLPFHV